MQHSLNKEAQPNELITAYICLKRLYKDGMNVNTQLIN